MDGVIFLEVSNKWLWFWKGLFFVFPPQKDLTGFSLAVCSLVDTETVWMKVGTNSVLALRGKTCLSFSTIKKKIKWCAEKADDETCTQ